MIYADWCALLDVKHGKAKCPAHEDRNPSLSVTEGHDGSTLIKCHAGCDTERIVAAVGRTMADLYVDPGNGRAELVATYDYRDESGALLYQVCRFFPKTFKQRCPDGAGGWTWRLNGVRRVLYRLPELRAAIDAGKRVFIVEGEKDVAAVEKAGYAATCNSGGAGKWRPEYSAVFAGANVVLVADKDEPGRKHAHDVATSLHGVASKVVTVEAAEGTDVSDHLAAGKTLAELVPVPETPERTKETNKAPLATTSVPLTPPSFVSFVPPSLSEAALFGLPGEFVRVVGPHSEADPAALLIQFLVAFGNCAGRATWFPVEADRHHLNLNALLVGTTSKGRKGTSWGHVRSLFARVDSYWAPGCLRSGLSSGEGLIWEVRDPIAKQEPIKEKGRIVGYQSNVVDEGVTDKRLLVLEAEFASTLRVMAREGSTLSAVVRQAWDDGGLRALAKNSPAKATDAHISIIGHITKDELRRELTQTDAANGFANRFLFVCSRRSKALPEGGHLAADALDPILWGLDAALKVARQAGELRRDAAARALWASVYPELSEGRLGLLGAATGRAEAQVVRLSCLYALLDRSVVVCEPHLQAALALWDYCAQSAAFVFGDTVGDHAADEVWSALRQAGPEGLGRTEINAAFHRNRSAEQISRALAILYEQGHVDCTMIETGGRPREVWRTKETKKGAAALSVTKDPNVSSGQEQQERTALEPTSPAPRESISGPLEPRNCPKGHPMTHLAGTPADRGWVCSTCYPATRQTTHSEPALALAGEGNPARGDAWEPET
jgi:hypothetical protein